MNDPDLTVFLLDLDNDPSSGGSPGDIGIPTALAGVDLIVAVSAQPNANSRQSSASTSRSDVVPRSGVVQATPNVKKFDASLGSFVGVASPGIIATVLPTKLGLIPADPEAGEPSINEVQLGQIISAETPGAVVGSTPTVFRLEALAQHSTSTVDRAAARISFELPVFPSCEVMPAAATLGATVSVDAEGLEPDATASVILGGHMVATGSVDDGGRAAIAFTVPEAVSTGLQPLRVSVEGTAVTADCSLFLDAAPGFDVPPTPPSGATQTAAVGGTLNFVVQASDRDADDVVSINVIGGPLGFGATFSSTSGNPATGTFVWSVGPADIGTHLVTFIATDDGGRSASPHNIIIEVVEDQPDTTPPRCEVIGVNIAHPAPPTNLLVEVQDTDSGLDAINGLVGQNAVVNIPAFSVGTNAVVQVVADKIDEGKRSRVEIQAIDVEGNSSTCDPVLATLTRGSPTLPLTEVSFRERYLTISPSDPATSLVMANVNGSWFRTSLGHGSVTIDLGSAMTSGSDNTVTVWASSDTTILLADAVPNNATISAAVRPWWHSAWSQAPVRGR